jgi:hypothetical protein
LFILKLGIFPSRSDQNILRAASYALSEPLPFRETLSKNVLIFGISLISGWEVITRGVFDNILHLIVRFVILNFLANIIFIR